MRRGSPNSVSKISKRFLLRYFYGKIELYVCANHSIYYHANRLGSYRRNFGIFGLS